MRNSDGSPPTMFQLWGQHKMLVLILLGFSSGLPQYLTQRTLQAWMTVEGVSLATIGVFSLVALPYSLKFLWSPLMDRYTPSFLGRRRGWLVVTQVALLFAIAAMSVHDPQAGLQLLAVNAVLIAFFSASQDIVGDAYRTDVLRQREMPAGAAIWVMGYRVALLVTAALAFMLADRITWPVTYLVLSLLMLVGIGATLFAPEPASRAAAPETLTDAVVLPFKEFAQRSGLTRALLVLLFIVLYKYPDYLAAVMATPFLLDIGFSQTDIGAIQGGLGIAATMAGAVAGGSVAGRLGINRSLWVFGVLQAVSNLAYYVLARAGADYPTLVGAILVENFCAGMVTAGFLGFIMSLCSVRFSATQFALLTSIMSASRDVLVSPSGAIAAATGWEGYFLITLAVAIPGFVMLPFFAPWSRTMPLNAAPREADDS